MSEYDFSIGDVVDGFLKKTKIRGIIDGFFLKNDILYANVYVTRSVGKEKYNYQSLDISTFNLIKVNIDYPLTDGEILNFIDMALIEKNKEWFEELTNLLKIKNRPNRSIQKIT